METLAMESPPGASEGTTPTADPPRIQFEGTFYCNACGYGRGSSCACDDRSVGKGKGVDGMPTMGGEIVSDRFCPVDGGPFEAGLAVNWKPVPPLPSGVQRDHQHLMALCLYFWPHASVDYIRAFIFSRSGGARWYRREDIVGALSPFSQPCVRRWVYETQPPPYGVASVARRQLLDVAEFGIALVRTAPTPTMPAGDNEENKMNGGDFSAKSSSDKCAYDTLLVQKPWCYGPATNFVVMLGGEAGDPNVPDHELGSVARPRLWSQVMPVHHLQGDSFPKFVEAICRSLSERPAPYGSDHRRVITWDDHPTRSNAKIFEAVRSVGASTTATVFGAPRTLRGSPFVGVPRPLSHPGRAPAKRCLLDAIGKVLGSVEGLVDLCPLQLISHLQDALASDLSGNGNALRWFDKYREDSWE